jgi:ABC-2 type transport system permease protein
VLSTALFYGSPVLYAIDKVPEQYRQVLMLVNPLADILEQGRRWVIDPNADGAIAAAGGGAWILVPIAVGTAVCALGVWVFNREAPRIAERL